VTLKKNKTIWYVSRLNNKLKYIQYTIYKTYCMNIIVSLLKTEI